MPVWPSLALVTADSYCGAPVDPGSTISGGGQEVVRIGSVPIVWSVSGLGGNNGGFQMSSTEVMQELSWTGVSSREYVGDKLL